MLTREQTLACKVPPAIVQKSKTSGSRQSATLGVACQLRWYLRLSCIYSNTLTCMALDILSGKLSSNNGAQGGKLWVTSTPQHLDYFKSFDGITSLTLDHVTLFDFPALQHTFWGLIPTVVCLRLLYPRGSPSSLLQFITTFRNLEAVTVHAPSWTKPDQGIHHVRIGQLQGSLCLSEFDDKSRSFLSLLESHATGMKKVTISNCNFYDSHPLQRLLSSARRSIQTLEIIVDKNGRHSRLSLMYLF